MISHHLELRFITAISLFLFVITSEVIGVEFRFRLPVASTATVNEVNGNLQIECRFSPTKAFSKQTNKRVDTLHARKIVYNSILMYMNKSGRQISYSGLISPQPPVYQNESQCVFYFSVPKSNIKVVNKSVTPKQNSMAKASTVSAPSVKTKESPKTSSKSVAQPKGKAITPTPGPVPVPVKLISDAEMKKLAFSGYSIRVKQDVQTLIDDFETTISELKNANDLDSLIKLPVLIKTMESHCQECIAKISDDSRLLGSEISDIQKILLEGTSRVKKDAQSWGITLSRKLIQEAENELRVIQKALAKAETDQKAEIEADIKTYKQTISELKQIEMAVCSLP